MKKYSLFILSIVTIFAVKAQPSSEILAQLESFNSFKTVLYLAAHPDDENTRVISWLVNGEHARTGYLSLTRGDGGQNLIGTEIGDELGILRTRELLAARSIDGGEQYFTRAVDFGYSRSAEETLEKWDEEQILSDVVWVIRKFRPQLIITRFPPDKRAGHGHHTASAMLAIQAFEAAADENQFPEQLEFVEPWQVQSVYWNGSLWWDKDLEKDFQADSAVWRANIGGYNPYTGKSYNELGSLARSQHKCQGFGVDIQRGETFEYFRPLAGVALPNGLNDLETPTWESLGVPQVEKMVANVVANFDVAAPQNSLTDLAAIYTELYTVKNTYWREQKQKEIEKIIRASAGLFVEALTDEPVFAPNQNAEITVNFLARLTDKLSIDGVMCNGAGMSFKAPAALPKNKFATYKLEAKLPGSYSNPYWLIEPYKNMYVVDNQQKIGQAANKPLLEIETSLFIDKTVIPLRIPVKYKWRDRVEGELQRGLTVAPPVCINFDQPMSLNLNGEPASLTATVKWFTDSGSYPINFTADGWDISVKNHQLLDSGINLKAKGAGTEEQLIFTLTPQKGATQGVLRALLPNEPVRAYHKIEYAHIPTQIYMPLAQVNLVNLNVKIYGEKVAYIMGAGDRVAEGLVQMGYKVDVLDKTDLANADLSQYQAVVLGIRAYNTQAWLQNFTDKFFAYIQQGGNFIVQYNTASRFLQDAPTIPSPYPFTLGRNRVTEEDAKVKFREKHNPVFNAPNKLNSTDFDGWVQERGLYFATDWDKAYSAPIGWHDKGEKETRGGLLIAPYGKGNFMYTGISFFRELPAGVPGAYRLLANLISYTNKK